MTKELSSRWTPVQSRLASLNADALLLSSPVNLLYATGQIFNGCFWLPRNGSPHLFIQRPQNEESGNVHFIRKVEDIPAILAKLGLSVGRLALEGDELAYTTHTRLAKLSEGPVANGSGIMRLARSVKTPFEIALMREGGARHAKAISRFPEFYKPGMTDHQFAVECETALLRAGSLGLFRVNGTSMEVFMGTVLAGDNAGAVSPYDFGLGGAGLDASLPVGQNNTVMKPGMTVLMDIAFNHHGYLTDCTRTFSIGKPSADTLAAHQCCMDIQAAVANAMRPGVSCEELYKLSLDMADKAGYADRFMGLSQKAKFIGHGTGLYINEWPVLGARSTAVLEAGNVIALEPKIVLAGVGAVGVEDTFAVTGNGVENLTPCAQHMIEL